MSAPVGILKKRKLAEDTTNEETIDPAATTEVAITYSPIRNGPPESNVVDLVSSSSNRPPHIIELDPIPYIIMKKLLWNDNKESVKTALKTLYNLCTDKDEGEFNRRVFHDSGGHVAIVGCMNQWERCSYTQSLGCTILEIVSRESTVFCMSSVKVGSLKAVVAMKNFPDSATTQERGCRALEAMCYPYYSQPHRDRLVFLHNGVKEIVAAMTAFPTCLALQRSACKVLWALSYQKASRDAIMDAHGLAALVAVIQWTHNSENTQFKEINLAARSATINLCGGDSTRKGKN